MIEDSDRKHQIEIKTLIGMVDSLNNKIEDITYKEHEPIAIIGASCRFPGGANSIEEYWNLLVNGVDAISEVPSDRWNMSDYYDPDPDAANKMYCKWGGFLNTNVYDFDPELFDIVSLEAIAMDPQQRLALEVTWEAIERSGINPHSLSGTKTGVFFGVSTFDYAEIVRSNMNISAYTNSGFAHSVLAGRISYILGLKGPSLVLDTACSSSLVAIHEACQSLRNSEANIAIAGGVNLMLTPDTTIGFCKGGFLSVDGRCKTFDDKANGYVRGEGCGVIILKRLSDAEKNNDNILAIIKGSSVNQDGNSGGLTVPNGPAQEMVIKQALDSASIKPSEISYIEAHGTGTSLGDPIEVHALESVLKEGRSYTQPLMIGSVKTNIGHLEAAAGMAGIIKIILSMQNELLPKHLHFNKLNHNISLDKDIDLKILTENTEWKKGKNKRIAGISGFAFQGTNAHVIVEEYPVKDNSLGNKAVNHSDRPVNILTISARNNEALRELVLKYVKFLREIGDSEDNVKLFADICFTANTSRAVFQNKICVVATNALDAKNKLEKWLESGDSLGVYFGETKTQSAPKIAFLFSGQGSQYVGMGKELYDTQPTFRDAIEKCAAILENSKYLDKNLLSILWGEDSVYLNETKYTQPALFAIEYALATLWISWGIIPQAVMGHSVGEYAASCIAGVFSLEDGLKLISARARLIQDLPKNGSMISIAASEELIIKEIKSLGFNISIAAINGPESIVVSGDSEQVKKLANKFEGNGFKIKELNISHAFHSHLLEPILDEFKKYILEIKLCKPKITLISNLTGDMVSESEITKPEYWVSSTRNSVKFAEGINKLVFRGFNNFIEIGPHPVLLGMAQENIPEDNNCLWLPSLRKDTNSWQQLLERLSSFYINYDVIDFNKFDKDYIRNKVLLPTYQFNRKRYCVEINNSNHDFSSHNLNTKNPLLKNRIESAKDNILLYETLINPQNTLVLGEHRVYGVAVLPAVAYLEMVVAAVKMSLGHNNSYVQLFEVAFERALAVLDQDTVSLQLDLTSVDSGYDFSIYSRKYNFEEYGSDSWDINVTGSVAILNNIEEKNKININSIISRASDNYKSVKFLEMAKDGGMTFGPRFSSMKEIWVGEGEALGKIEISPEFRTELLDYEIYPPALDSGLQLLIAYLPFPKKKNVAHLPVGIKKLTVYKSMTPISYVYVTWDNSIDSNVRQEKTLQGNIQLLDEDGNLIIEIIGLSAIEAPQQAVLVSVKKENVFSFYDVKWMELSRKNTIESDSDSNVVETWLIFADNLGVSKNISTFILSNPMVNVVSVERGDCFNKNSESSYRINHNNISDYITLFDDVFKNFSIHKIINFWPQDVVSIDDGSVSTLELDLKNLMYNQSLTYGATLFICKTLLEKNKDLHLAHMPRLFVVTRDANDLEHRPSNANILSQAAVYGLSKVVMLEAPDLCTKMIDVSGSFSSDLHYKELYEEILSKDNSTEVLLYNDKKRYISKLEVVKIDYKQGGDSLFKEDASYLITGGLGGIGFLILSHMLENGAKNILIISRRTPDDVASKKISDLNTKFSANVAVSQVDVSDSVALKIKIEEIKNKMPQLKGIFHAAGVLDDARLTEQTWEGFLDVMKPKVFGAWNLHKLTADLDLDFFVLFSSQAAMLGNFGQANYAAANNFLNALSNYRNGNGLKAVSINWGPWLEVGMASNLKDKQDLESYGVKGISNIHGISCLNAIMLNSVHEPIGVFDIEWQKYLDYAYSSVYPDFFDDVIKKNTSIVKERKNSASKSIIVEKLYGSQPENRKKIIQTYLFDELTKILGGNAKVTIGYSTGFMDMGVDSLLAVEFRKIIKSNFDGHVKIPPTIAFDYPNIDALGGYILSQMQFENLSHDVVEKDVQVKPSKARPQLHYNNEPIAIIGMSCRFPGGANNLDQYWSLLKNGVDAICEVPKDRWDIEEYFDADPDAPGKMYSRWGGFLRGVDVHEFDANFFNISPGEARDVDPQQRLLLEVSWEALENAGIDPTTLNNSQTGMFVGQGTCDYAYLLFSDLNNVSPYTNSGNSNSVTPGRASYTLGLQGPCMTIDTACSSSLIAIHEACNALRLGEADLSLVGGVNLDLAPELTIGFCKAKMLSVDGRCKTFDASANGYARGEGCGVIILKRLSDAKKDGDRILAVVRGSATNQDGASGGLTVPNGPSQQAVMRKALQQAEIEPAQVSYIETHGTGTSLGDPIEVQALGVVYGEGRDKDDKLTIASVKTNFGHLETAAGMASIIKVVLSMQNKQIPKHLNFKTINPMISLEDIPAQIPIDTRDWVVKKGKRIAGVSGFAFQGSNAHVIVEEAPELLNETSKIEKNKHIISMSAKTESALKDLITKYTNEFLDITTSRLEDICYTANVGRARFEYRCAVVAESILDLKQKLEKWLKDESYLGVVFGKAKSEGKGNVFLFTGQGSQYAGMGKILYDTQPVFKTDIDLCADILNKNKLIDKDLKSLLWGDAIEYLDNTKYTQPVLFAFEYSLFKLWASWGVLPQAVMGHSVGEYVAACVAGVFSLEDGLKLISKRAQLMQALPKNGSMMAIAVSEEIIFDVIKNNQKVAIAAINGPESIVISGESLEVKKIGSDFAAKGIKVKELQVSHAFHSPLIDGMLSDFEKTLSEVKFSLPNITYISNVTGVEVSEEVTYKDYWIKHTRDAVRFYNGVKSLLNSGYNTFIEIGPNPVLVGMAQEIDNPENNNLWLPSISKEKDESTQLLESLSKLFVSGLNINWNGYYKNSICNKVSLPTYQFQRKKHWIEFTDRHKNVTSKNYIHPFFINIINSIAHNHEVIFNGEISVDRYPYLIDHKVYNNVVVPGAAFIEMALVAASDFIKKDVSEPESIIIRNVTIEKPLVLMSGDNSKKTKKLQLSIELENDDNVFKIATTDESKNKNEVFSEWTVHAAGVISKILDDDVAGNFDFNTVRENCNINVPVNSIYDGFKDIGIDYGDNFRCINSISVSKTEVFAELELHDVDDSSEYIFHPSLLDSSFQVMGALWFNNNNISRSDAYLPFEIEYIRLRKNAVNKIYVYVIGRESNDDKIKKADIIIYDNNGKILLEIIGFSAVKITKDDMLKNLISQGKLDISNLLYGINWVKQPLEINNPPKDSKLHNWILVGYNNSVLNNFSKIISENDMGNVDIFDINIAKIPESFNGKIADRVVLFFDGNDYKDVVSENCAYANALIVVKNLISNNTIQNGSLSIVTVGADCVNDNQNKYNFASSVLNGLSKVINIEYPELQCHKIDLDPDMDFDQDKVLKYLCKEILYLTNEESVALRNDTRYVQRLTNLNNSLDDNQGKFDIVKIDSDSAYLITGGLGGLGIEVAKLIIQKGAKKVFLIGRKEPDNDTKKLIIDLQSKYSNLYIKTISADVSDIENIKMVFAEIEKHSASLKGIIHAAGVIDDAAIMQQNFDDYVKVMAPKVLGALNIQQEIESRKLDLDFIIYFSSVTAVFGNFGQANYAAANSFLNLFAAYQRHIGINAISINWGPWSGIGMFAGVNDISSKQLLESGISPLAVDQGIKVLDAILFDGVNESNIVVLDVNWDKYLSVNNQSISVFKNFQNAKSKKSSAAGGKKSLIINSIINASVEERLNIIKLYLETELRAIMDLGAESDINYDNDFNNIGLNSLMAVEFRNKLIKDLGSSFVKTLPVSVFFNYKNINLLSEYLIGSMLNLDESKPKSSEIMHNELDVISDDVKVNLHAKIVVDDKKDLSEKNIFLTGANGFLGVYLLEQSLLQNSGVVYCLVRANNNEDAKKKLFEGINKYGIKVDKFLDRIIVLHGDTSKENLGLSENDFMMIAEKVDLILHAAAKVNHIYEYDALRLENVVSMDYILKLATIGKSKTIHYVSSAPIVYSFDKKLIDTTERRFQAIPKVLPYGYLLSKIVSEIKIENAIANGFDINIYRPSQIMAVSGTLDPSRDMFLSYIVGCLQMGAFPVSTGVFNLLSVDVVAKAIVFIMLHDDKTEKVYNIVNSSSVSWELIFTWLRNLGYKFDIVPLEDFATNYLPKVDKNNCLYTFKSNFESDSSVLVGMSSLYNIDSNSTQLTLARHNVKNIEYTEDNFKSTMQLIKEYLNGK